MWGSNGHYEATVACAFHHQCFHLAAGSREVKYNNVSTAAMNEGSLSYDPMILPGFSSTSGQVPEAVKNLNKNSDENHFLIPTLHQALAQQLGVEVAEVETCPTFVLGSNAVVDSHAVDTIEGLKPDIVVVSNRYLFTMTQMQTHATGSVMYSHQLLPYDADMQCAALC